MPPCKVIVCICSKPVNILDINIRRTAPGNGKVTIHGKVGFKSITTHFITGNINGKRTIQKDIHITGEADIRFPQFLPI